MSLTSGTRLGPYEITSAIGAGGMGEVYRATDNHLKRSVAIKVLPAAVAGDSDRLARFQREAEVLAALNHPNIAAIYGIVDLPPEGGTHANALVMELVEGDDLSQRIARGALPIDEALPIARQIAHALEAAHEQGIVHRDLKPANIKVRADGTVKVLDFGLAKALAPEGASASAEAMNSPTLTARATRMGTIIGTAAYMAPEQAKGKAVDKRADVWAFGVVLYEMLTGRRAFLGDDVSETLASVLKDTPSLAALPADVPQSVRRLLRRSLEKDRAKRLDSMAAARLEIEDALAGEPAAPDPGVASRPPAHRVPGMVAGVGLALLVGAAVWWQKPVPVLPAPSIARFAVRPALTSGWTRTGRHVVALSPDGRHLAFIADSKLFLRKLDQFEATPMSSVTDPLEVFFSSDSAWIGFFADGKLQKVALSGGAPIPICATAAPLGASWADDQIVYAQVDGLYRVSANGGTPELIAPRASGERQWSPHLLPGRESVLYTRSNSLTAADDAEIVVEHLATRTKTVLVRGGTDARYLPGGYVVYGRAGEILVMAVDWSAPKAAGTPVSMVSGVAQGLNAGVTQFSVSMAGGLAYVLGSQLDSQLVWADVKGGHQPITREKRRYLYPRVSPDGGRVLYTDDVAGNRDVFVMEWARESKIRVTKEMGADDAPVWSPDGRRIAYSSTRPDVPGNLYVRAADGSGTEERLTTSANYQVPFAWSTEDDTLVYVEQDPKTGNDIHAIAMSGDRKPRPLVATPFDERRPALSPDGHWLAYGSNEQGMSEIHVRPYPDVNRARYQASAGGGTSPLWAPDGKAIYYRQGGKILRVSITTMPDFKAGKPEDVRAAPSDSALGAMSYDLDPSGKRFVLVQPDDAGAVAEYRVVLNWIEDVKVRVGAKK